MNPSETKTTKIGLADTVAVDTAQDPGSNLDDLLRRHPDRWTQLLTPDEVANRLRLSRSQVYEYLRAERLPSIQLGRSRRVLLADLAAFIAAERDQG